MFCHVGVRWTNQLMARIMFRHVACHVAPNSILTTKRLSRVIMVWVRVRHTYAPSDGNHDDLTTVITICSW
jgi:hypothetical protein